MKAAYYKEKLNSGNKKELVFDSMKAIFIRVGSAVSLFLMNLVVARRLGSSNSGVFFLCFAVITVLATLVRMGGDNLMVKYVGIYGSEGKWKTAKLVVSVMSKRIFLFASVITALLILFHTAIAKDIFHKETIAETLFWMLLSMPLLAIYTLVAFGFQGLKKVLISVSIQNIIVPVTLSALVFVFKPDNSVDLAMLYFISSAFTVILTLFLWQRIAPKGCADEEAILPDNFWKSSYAMWSFAIVQMATQWAGQFIAGIYCAQKQLGQLAVAQRTSMLISFILVAINLVSAPKFASLYKQGKGENLKRYAINTTRLMVLFSTPIVLVILCFPRYIMTLFGPGFADGAPMLFVFALGQYVNVLTGSVTLLLMMSGHERDMRNLQIFIGIFCIILNLILVRTNGAFGAALATAISIAVQNLICAGIVKKRLGFNTLAIWSRS